MPRTPGAIRGQLRPFTRGPWTGYPDPGAVQAMRRAPLQNALPVRAGPDGNGQKGGPAFLPCAGAAPCCSAAAGACCCAAACSSGAASRRRLGSF